MPSYSITNSKNNCSSNLSLPPCSLWIMPPFTKLRKPGNSLRKADTSYSFFLPILPISTRLKNTSQTSKKFALISRQTLLLTTLFDCTDINDFYYKEAIHEIWQAETKINAEKAFELFIETYQDKYPKATLSLQQDREELLAFYDFPAKHWQSIRTSNPIESTFGTIRHRTKRSKGCLNREGMLHMMFKLGQCAEKNWRKLRGFDYLPKVIEGVQFSDGIEVIPEIRIAA